MERTWLGIRRKEVFRLQPFEVLKSESHRRSPDALLDTTPLKATGARLFSPDVLRANVDEGRLAGVGVVATYCPQDGSGGRSRMFYCGKTAPVAPDSAGSLDDVPSSTILHEHLLASAAVPALFPAVEVTAPASAAGWYIDGGVRLNTPIKPAIDLGADRLIVLSSYAATYPSLVASPPRADRPAIPDVTAQSVHALLGDGMIEDLRRLRKVNAQVLAGKDTAHRVIEHLVVAPRNGTLSDLAQRAREKEAPLIPDVYSAMELLMPGSTGGNHELLSYLYFDPGYFEMQFAQGRTDAREVLAASWKI